MHGFQKPTTLFAKPVLDATPAIMWLRAMRPGSIENAKQERFVASWISYREEQPHPVGATRVEGRLRERAELVLLVGLPGSGNSWLSAARFSHGR
jgi:atypical dual specificity phosphatase